MSSWFWLLAGFLCLIFGNGRWAIPIAAWLYPLFLLRFTHRQPVWRGFIILTLVLVAGNSIAWWGTATSNPASALQFIPAGFGIPMALIFLGERWLSPKLKNGTASLVFPLLYVTFEWLVTRFSPLGSIGILGYTQYDDLPLIQLASLTGASGITFLMAWFGSLANWVWEHQFTWTKVRIWVGAYAGVLALVLMYGGARLAFATPPPGVSGTTIRVAGITVTDRRIMAELDLLRKGDPAAYPKKLAEIETFAFAATRREARSGAKVVLWNEVAMYVENDTSGIVSRAQALARQESIYLVVPLYITYPGTGKLDVNKLVLIDPQGQIGLDYLKFGSAALEGIQPGNKILSAVQTPFGILSAVICRDLDFPDVLRQAGRNGTQVLLAPSFDWYAIDPFHSRNAVMRAVENGVSLVRQVADGYSVATDPFGRVVAASDYFASQERVMVAEVPVAHIPTLYAWLGDWFNWLAGIALAGLVWSANRR